MQIGALPTAGLGHEGLGPRDASRIPAGQRPSEFSHVLKTAEQAVQPQRTRLSTGEASSALASAWGEHFGSEPKPETVAILTAQWSHETGGGSSMFNFNFGGIKGTGPSGLHVTQRTREGHGASEITIRDRFRAYQSADEGALDYVSLLSRKYPKALEAAEQGDAAGFVEQLHAGGYFTGDKSAYVRSVANKAASLLGQGIDTNLLAAPRRDPSLAPMRSYPAPARLERSPSPSAMATAPAPPAIDLQSFTDHLAIAALRIAERPERENT